MVSKYVVELVERHFPTLRHVEKSTIEMMENVAHESRCYNDAMEVCYSCLLLYSIMPNSFVRVKGKELSKVGYLKAKELPNRDAIRAKFNYFFSKRQVAEIKHGVKNAMKEFDVASKGFSSGQQRQITTFPIIMLSFVVS
jgi:hypothetical protein